MYTATDRLMRSRDERMIAGVAGGIARYLTIDPALVRLAFVALAFTGIGVLVYPLLWLIMPMEGATGPSINTAVGEMRQQAARVSDEVREVFVKNQPQAQRVARFDPQTGQPIADDPNEVPINNVGGQNTPASRYRLLGYVLLALGGFLLLNLILPGAEQFIFPAVLLVAGYLLLRRRA